MSKQRTSFSIILIFVIVFTVMVSASPETTPAGNSDPLLESFPSEADSTPSTDASLPDSTQTDPVPTETEPLPTETEPAPTETEPLPAYTELVFTEFSSISAANAFVYDCRTDYLYTNTILDATLYPASITKLFTVYVAKQYLDPDSVVTVGSILSTVPSNSSTALLSRGNKLTVESLYYGMLLPSGNDAARVIAVAAGKVIDGTTDKPETDYMSIFVEEMNRQASLVGFIHSHFVTPDGYHDPDHYMCLADMVTLGKLCIADPYIMGIVSTAVYTAEVTGKSDGLLWLNSNKLLHPYRYNPSYYCESALGLKTGYTSAAGPCLLSVFSVEDGYLLIGVFHCSTKDNRFADSLTLFKKYQAA